VAAPKRKKEPRARAFGTPSAGHALLPRTAVLAAVALLPVVFTRGALENFEFPKTELMLLIALLMLAWWTAGELARVLAAGPTRWIAGLPSRAFGAARSDPAGAGILLFLLSAVASTLTSINPRISLHGAAESYAGLPVALATASVYFASRAAAKDASWLERVGLAAALGAAIASGYALLQLSNLDPIQWHRTASFGGAVRIFGTMGHPNFLGAYLATALPLVAWRAARASSPAGRIAILAVVAASFAALVATLSRGAWVALAASGVVWAALRLRASRAHKGAERERAAVAGGGRVPGPRLRVAIVFGVAIVALALLVPAISTLGPNLRHRFREIGNFSAPTTRSRLEIWRAGLRMASDHPILGVGVDAFGAAFPRYRTADYWRIEWGGTPVKAHNEPIQILATQGMFGEFAALLVVLLTARAVWRASGSRRPAVCQGAAAAGAALAAFATQNLASFTTVAMGTFAAAVAGWAAAQAAGTRHADDAASAVGSTAPRRSLGGVLVGGAAAVALFVPLVLSPWRAERAAHDALLLPQESTGRSRGLARAESIAPWDARYPSRIGIGLLNQATRETDPRKRWALLEGAGNSLTRAIVLAPESQLQRACLARTLARQSKLHPELVPLDSARAQFAEVLERDPANALLMVQEEESFMEIDRNGEAHSVAFRAATLYPEFGKPFADLGYIALLEGRNQDAADTLRRAVTKEFYADETTLADAWANLSAAYLNLKRDEDALVAAERALALVPDHRNAILNRRQALRGLGRGGG
jgi:O-antigen ligase